MQQVFEDRRSPQMSGPLVGCRVFREQRPSAEIAPVESPDGMRYSGVSSDRRRARLSGIISSHLTRSSPTAGRPRSRKRGPSLEA